MELRNREQISSNCRETHLVPGRGGESGGFASANETVTTFGQVSSFRTARRIQLATKINF
jgi:hypothetical protein